MVTARAWCRVDLAGGTLDIWPLGILHPGAQTVNLALDLPVTVSLARREEGYRVEQDGQAIEVATLERLAGRPESSLVGVVAEALELPPVEASIASRSPRGGGLGASSALAVALIAAGERLLGLPDSAPAERAALARDLEARLMSLPTGIQDHYPALLGGALKIAYRPGGESVRRLETDLEALGRSLVVAYSGASHFSAGQNWAVLCRRLAGEHVELFDGIAETAIEMAEALETGDLERAGRLMDREWGFRRLLADGISTPEVERLLEAARDAGAWGGKACGAGGGGCVAVLAPAESRSAVAAAMAAAGGEVLRTGPTAEPLSVDISLH